MSITFKEYAEQEWAYDGLSAKTIYDFCLGRNTTELNYPHDPDDLCRCMQVLRFLHNDDENVKVQVLLLLGNNRNSKHYKALGKNWIKLMEVFKTEWETDYAPKTYDFMQKIYDE